MRSFPTARPSRGMARSTLGRSASTISQEGMADEAAEDDTARAGGTSRGRGAERAARCHGAGPLAAVAGWRGHPPDTFEPSRGRGSRECGVRPRGRPPRIAAIRPK